MPRKANRSWQAFASALGIEAAVVGIGIALLATHPPAPLEKIVPISIETLVEPPVQKPLAPEPEKIKPPPPPPPIVRPLPAPVPPVRPPPPAVRPPPPAVRPPPAAVQAAPVPQTTAVPPSTPVPSPVLAQDAQTSLTPAVPNTPAAAPAPVAPQAAPTPAAQPSAPVSSVDPSPAYNVKLAAAVQAVFEVPAAAAALNFKGRTRVEFSLRDGVVSAARVIQTSGLGAVDRAAIKAVQAAAYPAPPPALQGKENLYQIWVACL
jgi:periplasmic protein TonB